MNHCLLLLANYVENFMLTDPEVDKSIVLFDYKISETEEPIVIRLPEDVQCLSTLEVYDFTSLNYVLPREQGLANIGKSSYDLKVLRFGVCPNLKNLFSLRLLPALQNLEYLEVDSCDSVKEIAVVDDEETEKEIATNTVPLPRLNKLRFDELPALECVCGDNAVLVCNSLQAIEVYDCPKLKRLSLSLPLLDNGQPCPTPALQVIKIKKELREPLERDQADAKDVLNPYSKFYKR